MGHPNTEVLSFLKGSIGASTCQTRHDRIKNDSILLDWSENDQTEDVLEQEAVSGAIPTVWNTHLGIRWGSLQTELSKLKWNQYIYIYTPVTIAGTLLKGLNHRIESV